MNREPLGLRDFMHCHVRLTALCSVIVFALVASVPHHAARAGSGAVVLVQAAAADRELTPEQRARLKAEIARVPSDLKGRFDVRYRAWRYSWLRKPLIFNSKSARPPAEFRALISLGPGILPLLVGKLANGDDSRALQAYDALQDHSDLRVDPQAYPNERQRALETVRRWLARA
jgi:hypothetical protein